jgi:hypothetical protein
VSECSTKCGQGCGSVKDIVARVSSILSDDSKVNERTWSIGELIGHLNEGLCELVKLRPDAFVQSVTLPLTQGSRQKLPCEYASLVKVNTNLSTDTGGTLTEGSSVTEADGRYLGALKKKPCLSSTSLCAEQKPYVVSSYTRDGLNTSTFVVSPPVPPGVSVSVDADVVVRPVRHTTAAVDECVGVPCEYEAALVNWMLHRAYAKETESQYANAQVDRYLKAWYENINAGYLQDSRFIGGYWTGTDQNRPSADPQFRQH